MHHAKLVKAWLERHDDEIEIFYLPSYSPELNPDEYLNCDLKMGIRSSSPARNHKDLKGKAGGNVDAAVEVGKLVAERAKKAGVSDVVFDRGSYIYHGRVKALADAAREGGLSF